MDFIYYTFLVFFFLLLTFFKVQGYAHIAVSASLQNDARITSTGWKKLTSWTFPQNSGHVASSATINNGDFKASMSGLYNVYSTVTFSTPNKGLFKLALVINKDFLNLHNGLQSSLERADKSQSLSVFGTVRLHTDNVVSAFIYSETATNWTISGKSETTFGAQFIGFYAYVPGFSSQLSIQTSVQTSNWTDLLRWRSYGRPGLFQSRTGFSADVGKFAPICTGVYQISANVEYFAHTRGTFSLAVAINNDVTGSIIAREVLEENTTFSLSLSLAYKLEKGDLVNLKIRGTSPYRININSGFFGVLVNEGSAQPGFSTLFRVPSVATGKNWLNIPFPTPTIGFGQFNPGSVTDGRFFHGSQTIFTVSALLQIQASLSTSIILTLEGTDSVLALKTGLFTTCSQSSGVITYSISGILELPANQPLLLHVYLSGQGEFSVLQGSRVSVTTTQQQYQAFHLTKPSPTSFSERSAWIRLDNLKVSGDGSFVYTNTYQDGKYIAGISGVYYFTANIIFQDAHGPIGLLISVKGDTSKRRSLHATKGNPAVTRDSLSVTGALYVEAGSSVAAYIMIETDPNWSIDPQSSFSAVFIGQHFGVPGVSTVLKNRIAFTSMGWHQIKNWNTPKKESVMFDTGGGFNAAEGLYTASQTGLYLVATSLKLQDASAKTSTFTINIAVNGNPSSYTNQNGLQDFIENNFDPPLSNDYYSMVTGGVVKLNKGDTLSVFVHATVDNSFSISPDSSFSVIYLTALDSIYAAGMQLMLSESIVQSVKDASSWKKVRYWVTNRENTAPGVFFHGKLLTLDSDGGTIRILESGLYMINANIAMGSGDKEFEIGVHTTAGLTSLNTKYGQTPRLKYTLRIYGIMYFTTGQVISIRIRSTAPQTSWEQLRPYSALSFVRIPPFAIAPSVISGLGSVKTLQTAQSLWSRVRYWTTNTATTQELTGPGFNGENGYFVAKYDGIYLISCSISFQLSGSGPNVARMLIGLNGDTTLPGVKMFQSSKGASHLIPNCISECAEPLTQVLHLTVGDTVAVYVQSNLESVGMFGSTSFMAKYLSPINPIPNGFSMQLTEPLRVKVYGDKQVTGWTTTTDAGQFYQDTGSSRKDDYLINDNGLYLVSINIEFIDVKGFAKATPSLDNIPALVATHYTDEETSFTISVVGVMKVTAGIVYTVTIQTDQDQFYKIQEDSTSSLVYLGSPESILGFTATFNRIQTNNYFRGVWYKIRGWSTVGKDWLFLSGGGFESKESYIVQESGFYIIAANMMFTSPLNVSSKIELSLVRNNINNFANGLYGNTMLVPRKATSVQVHGGVYLNRWDFLELQFKVGIDVQSLNIEQESTFSIVKTGDDISSMPCSDFGPNIIGRIYPDNVRLKSGSDIEWNCFATGDNPVYQWVKDEQLIDGATGTKYRKTDLAVSDSGLYVCNASAGGIVTFSNVAKLTVFEPFPRYLNKPSEFNLQVPENGATTAELLQIMAQAESFVTQFAEINFSIIGGDIQNQFSISPNQSIEGTTLSRIKALDREQIATYVIQLAATNPLFQDASVIQNITIKVIDLNDNSPIFAQKTYNVTIPESTPVTASILTVSATDADDGANAVIRYEMIPGSSSDIFSVNDITGEITLDRLVNREQREMYVLFVKASDGVFSDYTEVTITLSDINEFTPRFLQKVYTVEVPESLIPGVPILRILAVDEDTGNNSKINYMIISGDPANAFALTETGDLQTTTVLDYETNETYHLVIGLQDYGNPPLVSDETASVTVVVRNTNDNKPRFTQEKYKGYLKENSMVFDPVFTVTARDPDGGGIDAITYAIPSEQNFSSIFEVTKKTGHIEVKKPLDYEQQHFYQFTVQALDTGLPPKVATAIIEVEIVDVNDNKPIFVNTSHRVQVFETSDTSREIYQVSATDADDRSGANAKVTYIITGGNTEDMFYINSEKGAVIAQKPLDREKVSYYKLQISAFDSGTPPQFSENTFTLEITVLDVNDNSPFFDKSAYEVSVSENAAVGSTLITFTVVDYDGGRNGQFNVTISETSFGSTFAVDKITESTFGLTLLKPLNYEVRPTHEFTVIGKDFGTPKLEKAVSVKVIVLDVNDHVPKFESSSYFITVTDTIRVNSTVLQMVATDLDPGRDRLSYEIIAGNIGKAFFIEKYTGVVRVSSRNDMTLNPTYELHIVAMDSFDPRKVSNSTILYVRVARKPSINLIDTTIGQFQIKTQIDMSDFDHLRNLVKYQVLVQQVDAIKNNDENTSKEPTSWHKVFAHNAPLSDQFRRYIAIEDDYPAVRPKKLDVVIGNNINCTSLRLVNQPICNGPLAAGKSYRLQVRVFETESVIDSYQSDSFLIPAIQPEKATLEEPIEDGMVALAAAFCLIVGVVIVMILVYTCWKMRHEIVHTDHLRESRGIPRDSSPGQEFFGSPIGKIQKFGGFDSGSMWPQLSMTEQNQMLHRSKQGAYMSSQSPKGGHLYDFKPQFNKGYQVDDGDDDVFSFRSEGTDNESAMLTNKQQNSLPMIHLTVDNEYDDQEAITSMGSESLNEESAVRI